MKTTKPAILKTGVAAAALSRPVVMVTNHEPLLFRRRVGQRRTDEVATYEYERSEAAVAALARRGVTWYRTHFYKGFGLQAEREEIARTKQLVLLCHRHGIKVEVYIQWGTLQYETLLAECPDMRDWCVVTEEGRYAGINYAHQYFRPLIDMPRYHGPAHGFEGVDPPGQRGGLGQILFAETGRL